MGVIFGDEIVVMIVVVVVYVVVYEVVCEVVCEVVYIGIGISSYYNIHKLLTINAKPQKPSLHKIVRPHLTQKSVPKTNNLQTPPAISQARPFVPQPLITQRMVSVNVTKMSRTPQQWGHKLRPNIFHNNPRNSGRVVRV